MGSIMLHVMRVLRVGAVVLFAVVIAVVVLYVARAVWRVLPYETQLVVRQTWMSHWLDPAFLGDGQPATALLLCYPMGLAIDQAGDLLVSDRGRGRRGRVIWRIANDGVATLLAGTGLIGSARAHRADEISFKRPEALAVAQDGSVFVSDGFNHVVVRIGLDGTVERVAGTGEAGFSGDGGPGPSGKLDRPADLRLDHRGNLYIADVHNHRIRKLNAEGQITTVVGTGEQGFSPDGVSATQARIDTPWGLGLDLEDRLLFGDGGNHRVRRINAEGRLETLAGSGVQGHTGDGGPALEAGLNFPEALAMDESGRLFIGDEWNNAVRVVDTDGTISPVIGLGFPGRAQIGGIARSSPVDDPENVLVTKGGLIIADGNNGRVIRVGNDGVVYLVAGRGETEPCFSLLGD